MRKFGCGFTEWPKQSSLSGTIRRPIWLRKMLGAGAVASLCVVTACSGNGLSDAEHATNAANDTSAANFADDAQSAVPVQQLRLEVTGEYEFFGSPFVQGVEFEPDGSLLVGTGEYGSSEIYRLPTWLSDPASSQPEQVQALAPEFFGEGLTKLDNGTIWQLTWKESTAISRDGSSLEETGRAELNTEGWGACSFGDSIVTSDGSGTLTIRSTDFTPERTVPITYEGKPVTMLNELECVSSDDNAAAGNAADSVASARAAAPRTVWANVWQTPLLYRINLDTGVVDGLVDATELVLRIPPEQRGDIDVLNGIAAIPVAAGPAPGSTEDSAEGATEGVPAGPAVSGDFLLTGKRWPLAFSVRIR